MAEDNTDMQSVIRLDDVDWFLQTLVGMVNHHGISFGITLNVSGFLISGTLIGGKAYFDGIGTEFSTGFEAQIAENIKESFAKYGENLYSNKEKNDDNIPIGYIHLKDAKFYNTNGNPIPGNRGVWWRGRLNEVSGFMLGQLQAEQA